jgi:hypothetical protein
MEELLIRDMVRCGHNPSIGLFGRGGWSVGFLNGAIWAVGSGWGLAPTPRLPARPHLTMGGHPQPAPCPVWLPWVIHRHLCIYLWISVEHRCGTLGATLVTCAIRHTMCRSSHHVPFVTPCAIRHIDCSNRVTIVTKVDKVPTYVPSHQDAF